MKLHSERPFWFLNNGLIQSYPTLENAVTADVVVVGAGITGGLIADQLTQHGLSVVMLDSRDVGCGSTCASTALLQYEIDTLLQDLQRWCGPVANDLYRSGVDACRYLKSISDELDFDVGFRERPSCYLASSEADVAKLRVECDIRQAEGLPVEFWDADVVESRFDFPAPAALWSRSTAQLDPYRMTHALLRRVIDRGSQVFDRSGVCDFRIGENDVTFVTERGSATGRYGIIACGYESQTFLPTKVAKLQSTFAFISEPLSHFPGWPEECLIWESARPYLYLRTTPDHRLLAGGEDLAFQNEALRDSLLSTRVASIEKRVRQMFPRIPFLIDHSWAGTFAETDDGLPFIGTHDERPGLLFALCYGGNGITFSVLAAQILRDHLLGKVHPLASAVAFDRPSLKYVDK
ncbi:NAD(P)/FAD-dependent oxidoreductase [Schlesneria paludicola]|uniref:NAD(P)/FAD-dependent oxidoreductase n=1 Tax=Schlesneria paludicola TaxID=360056 RepID=UPI000299D3B2|nr:FAD-dependent oxidoreductase [Schlesneria paludicola]